MKKLLLGGIALGAVLAFSGMANAQIKLGVGGPITGPNAAFGAQLKNGAEQAVEDINAAGGVLGQKITISLGDDVSDPKQGVSVANKFVGDGVKWVLGHFNSGVTMPASEVYAENGILMISPSAKPRSMLRTRSEISPASLPTEMRVRRNPSRLATASMALTIST